MSGRTFRDKVIARRGAAVRELEAAGRLPAIEHGTVKGYERCRCRCAECKRAAREYRASIRARNRREGPGVTDARGRRRAGTPRPNGVRECVLAFGADPRRVDFMDSSEVAALHWSVWRGSGAFRAACICEEPPEVAAFLDEGVA